MPINPQSPESPALPQRRTLSVRWTVLAVAASLLCLACSAFIGYFAVGLLKDPYTKFGSFTWLWGLVGCVTCIPPVLAGLSCLVYLATKSAGVLRITRRLLFAGIAAMIAQSILGFLLEMEAEAKGGDWKGLAVIASYVFGVMPPILVGALCVFLFWPLAKLRRIYTE